MFKILNFLLLCCFVAFFLQHFFQQFRYRFWADWFSEPRMTAFISTIAGDTFRYGDSSLPACDGIEWDSPVGNFFKVRGNLFCY